MHILRASQQFGKTMLLHGQPGQWILHVVLPETEVAHIAYRGTDNLKCWEIYEYIEGLAQDCSNSSVLAMELLQSCTKPLPTTWKKLKF